MGEYGQYVVPEAHEMVNFKVGQPAPSMLPLDKIRESAALKFAETDPMYLQYGHIQGYPKFRQALGEFLTKHYAVPVDSEELFITNGVTGGLALICSLFLQAGDLVFMEEPSYFLALSIMKDFKMNVRQVPMDEHGLNVDELEKLLQRGVVPKLLYIIPTCHNPTGRTLTPERRKRVVELSVKYGFIVVADEVYQLLSFPHVTPPPPMFTFDTHGTVLALGSFSKILAPALRLGWIQAKPKLLKPILECGQLDSSGGINPVISGIAHAAILSGKQEEHLAFASEMLWKRADSLMQTLKKNLPEGVTFEVPNGGYFVLVRLPEEMNASDLLPIAQKHKVMFLPGASFSESMKNYLRLSFSWYSYSDLEIGAQRLAEAIREYAANLKSCAAAAGESGAAPASTKLQVAINGWDGRLGSLIVNEMKNDNAAEFASGIFLPGNVEPDWKKIDVVVDATVAAATKALFEYLVSKDASEFKNGKRPAVVVGTTGELPIALFEKYASLGGVVVVKSNFSAGVPIVNNLIQRAAFMVPTEGWNVEVTEIHHTKKLDAPSGTAKTMVKNLVRTGAACLGDSGTVPTQSLRLGDEIGQHTVYFAGPGERIEIRHQATRREVFAIGAVRTVKEAAKLSSGLYMQ